MKKNNFSPGVIKISKILAVLIFAAYLFSGVDTGFARDNVKIAVIDLGRIMKSYNKREALFNKFEKEKEKKKQEITKLQAEVVKLRKALVEEIESLTEKQKEKKQKVLRTKLEKLQKMVKESNQELGVLDQDMHKELYEEIDKAVQSIARKQGYTLVIQNQGIIFYNQGHDDITDKVIKELNKKARQ
ncbi:MAG: OmpH family outer membrane protein [Candidatus Ratteibacteria bacterium]|nr:OmpH family outer membrane protein [Candidatus Ratteibacteria bacterium]